MPPYSIKKRNIFIGHQKEDGHCRGEWIIYSILFGYFKRKIYWNEKWNEMEQCCTHGEYSSNVSPNPVDDEPCKFLKFVSTESIESVLISAVRFCSMSACLILLSLPLAILTSPSYTRQILTRPTFDIRNNPINTLNCN